MKNVIYKTLCVALCLTMLAGCGKNSENDTKTTNDTKLVNEVTGDTKSDNTNSDVTSSESSISPIAYSNCIVDSGASVVTLNETSAASISRKALNYNNVFGVGVDEDSIVPIDTQIQIKSVYFSSRGGNENITITGSAAIPTIKSKTDLFFNMYIVDLASGNIVSTTEERTYTVGNQEVTGKGYRDYSTSGPETVEFQIDGLIPSGYRDLGILICDAETLPLSEAQHNCKSVVEYTNISEFSEGNRTLLVFDLNQFGESSGYVFWPSDLMQ